MKDRMEGKKEILNVNNKSFYIFVYKYENTITYAR